MLTVSTGFDAGNIEVVSLQDSADIQLNIRKDNGSDFFQWFYYRLQGGAGQLLRMRLLNAAEAAYVDGWENYQAVASYDRQDWFRVPTRYENGELIIEHEPESNSIYYAYFAPYSFERHLDLLAFAEQSPYCQSQHLGQTLDGRDIEVLRISATEQPKKTFWVTARQHPGESMAEWFVEGFLERLLDEDDALASKLRQQVEFYVVPNMNPDGSVRGHLRTNAVGANLNREWAMPTAERSPEVLFVRNMMEQTGVDLLLDVHGDEALPCNFIAGQIGVPGVSDQLLAQEQQFELDLMAVNPDFQMERGYEPGKFGSETMTIAANWIGHRFNCPSMTLEMPFKDFDLQPDPEFGWSPARSIRLGESVLYPFAAWLDRCDDS
ncbi:M14 family metallopeptidase [Amphritea sp. HPY]|uniref:M14 family metallopeptidase n=1 Tax=Amphritea sp. HPY TaxID=3421652 RepID=UPI003D7C89B0